MAEEDSPEDDPLGIGTQRHLSEDGDSGDAEMLSKYLALAGSVLVR